MLPHTTNDFFNVHMLFLVLALILFFLYGIRSAIKNVDLVGLGLFFLTLAFVLWRF
jgi:NADH:ubiquinone oxidoreductase subunit 3 (subunit A)